MTHEIDMNRPKPTIEDDLALGQRLIPVKELPAEPWMPKAPKGKDYSYKTIWKWESKGLEVIGYRPKTTTKGAVLRYFRHLQEKNRIKLAAEVS